MKRDVSLWQFAGFAFTSLIGTLLHFLYDWSNQNIIVSLISGVNESTWEHMKLMYFPLLIFSLIQSIFFKDYKNFWCVKFCGIVVALLLIPVLFYTYNGAFGKSPDWLNITIFFISAAITFIFETYLFKTHKPRCKRPVIAFLIVCFIGLTFVVFTFLPPKIPLFQDPIENFFGIKP